MRDHDPTTDTADPTRDTASYLPPRTTQLGLTYLAAGADIDRLLTDGWEDDLRLIRDTYRERAHLTDRLTDEDADEAQRARLTERRAALAEITTLHALRADKLLADQLLASRWMLMHTAHTTEGASWADLGAALDTTRQAAQQWYRTQRDQLAAAARTADADHDITEETTMPTITAAHIRELHDAEFADEAVLALVDGALHVWTRTTATDHAAEIITTATDVWEYCDGDLDDTLAAQLAADLTAQRQGRL